MQGATTGVSPVFKIADSAGTVKARVGIAGNAGALAAGSDANDLVIRSESGAILFTDDGGATTTLTVKSLNTTDPRVGIGTTDPKKMLHIKGAGSEMVFEKSFTNTWRIGPVSGGFVFDATDGNISSPFRAFAIQRSGQIEAKGAIVHTSDARLKTDIETIPQALDKS